MYPGNFFMPRDNFLLRQANPFFRGNLVSNMRIFDKIKAFNWKGLINGASKTINVVNQAIPLVKEAKPMVNNVRSIVKLAKAFGNETSSKKIINNYMDIKHNINVSNTKTDNNNSPTFFV